jgi:hypothetical protein
METDLILSVGGLPPLSARGCVQELMPVNNGTFRRTVNGTLLHLGHALKYRSIITCEDKTSLATHGLRPGSLVRVGCIQRLWQKVNGDQTIMLEREAIEGSIGAVDSNQQSIVVRQVVGQSVDLMPFATPTDGECFITYRPWLMMCVITYSLTTHEWGIKTGWRLELEEI